MTLYKSMRSFWLRYYREFSPLSFEPCNLFMLRVAKKVYHSSNVALTSLYIRAVTKFFPTWSIRELQASRARWQKLGRIFSPLETPPIYQTTLVFSSIFINFTFPPWFYQISASKIYHEVFLLVSTFNNSSMNIFVRIISLTTHSPDDYKISHCTA